MRELKNMLNNLLLIFHSRPKGLIPSRFPKRVIHIYQGLNWEMVCASLLLIFSLIPKSYNEVKWYDNEGSHLTLGFPHAVTPEPRFLLLISLSRYGITP